MKTKNILFSLMITLGIGTSSCDDSAFLKESPETFYTIENSFNTTDQVKASITNMYLHIRYWYQRDIFLKGIGTDLMDTPQWRSSGNGYSNFATWSTTYGKTRDVYNAMFQLVSYANLTLEGANTEKLKWDNEAERNKIIAEAYFFRGLAYLTLGELFGGVPLVESFITTPKYDFERSSREETYKFAISDLETAANSLPDYPEEAGKIAKGIAFHYLSEAYLALAAELNQDRTFLEKAVENATKVMGLHSLMTERFGTRAVEGGGKDMNGIPAYFKDGDVFFDLFQRGNLDYAEGNTEALWTFQNDYEVYREFGGDNFLEYPRNLAPVLRDAQWKEEYREEGAHASPWNSNIPEEYAGGNVSAYLGGRAVSNTAPTNYLINTIWEGKYSNDIRNSKVNIRRDFICLDQKHSMFGKVVKREMLAESNVDRFYPIWTKFSPIDDWGYEDLAFGGNRSNMYRDDYANRLAETYLLRAEAYFLLGDKAKAVADINALRSRAKCSYLVNEADLSIDLILDERARELFLEERRWCTLLRMGGTIMSERVKKYSYYMADRPSYSGNVNWNLFPFPQSVIDANLDAVLTQNPGWN